jgi:hypothetical protein
MFGVFRYDSFRVGGRMRAIGKSGHRDSRGSRDQKRHSRLFCAQAIHSRLPLNAVSLALPIYSQFAAIANGEWQGENNSGGGI